MNHPSLETLVTLRQAYLTMFEFLEREWERLGRPDELGGLLGNLALWNGPNGKGVPMDAAIFPEWIECARCVLQTDGTTDGYTNADIKLTSEPPKD